MNGGTKRILLVEPEAVVADVTAFRLELLGYQVETVGTAEDALKSITEQLPDMMITDLVLPGLEGMGLIERLASDSETSHLPIMVLSVDADLDQVQTAYTAGAVDFLVVPFHPEALQEKVAKHLANPRVRKPVEKVEVSS